MYKKTSQKALDFVKKSIDKLSLLWYYNGAVRNAGVAQW